MRSSHVPIRTCLGCGRQRPRKELVRICVKDRVLTIDVGSKIPGRGAYLCPRGECVGLLRKKKGRLAHALRTTVSGSEEEDFLRGLRQAYGGEGSV
jgi:uncharacterized protein